MLRKITLPPMGQYICLNFASKAKMHYIKAGSSALQDTEHPGRLYCNEKCAGEELAFRVNRHVGEIMDKVKGK